jgi:cell division protein FtsQ
MSRPTMTHTTRGSGLTAPPRPVQSAPPEPEPSGRARFVLRARQVRRTSWRWKVGLPLAALLVAAAVWLVYWGPVFVVKDVAVQGVSASAADEIRAAAAVPHGAQLARLDLSGAQRRVARIRDVRSAQVVRSWPDGVTITVTLRQPVAVVKDARGVLHLADSTGTTYAEVSSAPKDLPLVSADATDPAAVQAVVAVLAGLPAKLRSQVSSASAKDPVAVTLVLGNLTVVWGSAQDTALKAQVLTVLRRDNSTVRHFDLSAPTAPSVG